MSYILDALKKSEQERKLGDLPDISSDHALVREEQGNRLVPILLISLVLLLLCSGLLLFLYLNNDQAPEESAIPLETKPLVYQQQLKQADKDGSTPDREISEAEIIRPSKERREALKRQIENEKFREDKMVAEYEDYFSASENSEQGFQDQRAASESLSIDDEARRVISNIREENETLGDTGEVSAETDNQSQLNQAEKQKPSIDWYSYPAIAELDQGIKNTLPAIEVSTHIYSSAESYRKVTINGKGARQGAELGDGLILENITEEGVILSINGTRFRMKALEVWGK